MGNSSTRGKSKSLGPSIEALMSAVTPKHMAALLTMVKEINLAGQTSLDSAVHRAIGERGWDIWVGGLAM